MHRITIISPSSFGLAILVAVGCGSGKPQDASATSDAERAKVSAPIRLAQAPAGAAQPAATGGATISGIVKLNGQPPKLVSVKMDADPVCQQQHASPVMPETVVVDAQGMLKNAFVYVKDGLPEGSYDAPSEPVKLDQKDCEFSPRVFGVMAGQPLRLGNNDAFLHNVSSPEFNQAFTRGASRDVELDNPSVMVTVKCDVHPWMRAYAGVVEHPYFAVTGDDGGFTIEHLPDGEYTVAVWHEKLGMAEARVKASAAAPGAVDLTLVAK